MRCTAGSPVSSKKVQDFFLISNWPLDWHESFSNLSIIFTIGYYVEPCQNSDFVSSATLESMTRHMINELTIGSFDCPDVKCGFIGEIGCNYPLLGNLIINNSISMLIK